MNIQVKIKKLHEDAVIPVYAKFGDAGLDLTAVSRTFEDGLTVYGTGLAMEIPEGYVGLVFPRSSIAKKDMFLTNCVGVIDSGYRGEVMAKFRTANPLEAKIYDIGERICQLIIIPYPSVEFIETENLTDTDRGQGGFGSTN